MKTLLVVEDDPAIAELVRGILEDEGYAVQAASDGIQGLEQLRTSAFDLIFADLMMPNLNGRDFRRALESSLALQHIPVVLMTAASHVTDEDYRKFAAVLQKPFQIDDVLRLTARLLAPIG
jgi:CheY-like chemotaxis protein